MCLCSFPCHYKCFGFWLSSERRWFALCGPSIEVSRRFLHRSVYWQEEFAMSRYWAVVLAVLISVFWPPQSTSAPEAGRAREETQRGGRVCVYQDSRYQGWEQCYMEGDEVRSLGNHNAAASSLRIFGRAHVTVYDQTDFRGRSTEFASDVPDLSLRAASGGHTWNDRIESLRVGSDYSSGPNRNNAPVFGRDRDRDEDRGQDHEVTDGICVYDRRDFHGRSECWSAGAGIRDLATAGNWSDRISSIRVFGRAYAVAYRDVGFRGENIIIDRDIPDLAELSARKFRNWDRQISSLQIENERGFPGKGRGRGRPWR